MAGTIVRRHSPLRVAGVGCDRCGGDTRNSGSDDMLDATDDPQAEASDMTERCGRWRVLPAGVAAADLPALVPGWAVLRCKVAWGDTAILHCHWLPSAAIP